MRLQVGYTWRGKSDNATISHYCPLCCTLMEVTSELLLELRKDWPDPDIICCTVEHAAIYKLQMQNLQRQMVQVMEKGRRFRPNPLFLQTADDVRQLAQDNILNTEQEGM